MHTKGFHRNLGGQRCSLEEVTGEEGAPGPIPRPLAVVFHRQRERRRDTAKVPPSEGNEARREGHAGVGATHSTFEAGEPAPWDPVEGRGRRGTELEERKMKGALNPETVSTRLLKIAKLAREAPEHHLRAFLDQRVRDGIYRIAANP